MCNLQEILVGVTAAPLKKVMVGLRRRSKRRRSMKRREKRRGMRR